MTESQSVDWREAAAKCALPDGTPVPDRASDAIQTYLESASKGPLTGKELDTAAAELLEAWSKNNDEVQDAAG